MSKMRLLGAAALAGALALAGAASAATNITVQTNNTPLPVGYQIVDTFDAAAVAGFTFTGGSIVPALPVGVNVPGVTARPAGDTTAYESVQPSNGPAVLKSSSELTGLSIYMGSPDSFNSISFSGGTLGSVTLTGSQLFPTVSDNGDQTVAKRWTYDFGGLTFDTVTFGTTSNAFEFDDLATFVAGVPEPASWAMMIFGMGAIGVAMRRRNALQLV